MRNVVIDGEILADEVADEMSLEGELVNWTAEGKSLRMQHRGRVATKGRFKDRAWARVP